MNATIETGRIGFGAVNNYPPARWRLEGERNGSWELSHVARPGQRPWPPQFVEWAAVARIMGCGAMHPDGIQSCILDAGHDGGHASPWGDF